VWDKLQALECYSATELIYTNYNFPSKIIRLGGRGGNNVEKKIALERKEEASKIA
jgi:hypothetical protein